VGELPQSFDVDIETDLQQLIETLQADPSIAPATWRALNTLGFVSAMAASAPASPSLYTSA